MKRGCKVCVWRGEGACLSRPGPPNWLGLGLGFGDEFGFGLGLGLVRARLRLVEAGAAHAAVGADLALGHAWGRLGG